MISAGEVHTPGRPRDVVGLKAMAIYAQRCFTAFRPGGMKIHAGAPGDRARHGGERLQGAGRGRREAPRRGRARRRQGRADRAAAWSAWARKYGIQSTIHTGGPSIPGSGLIDSAVVLEADTDVVGHINGGHTALPDREIRCICEGCGRGLELVHNGNERAALYTLRLAREMDQLDRVILGTDGPAGLRRAAARHPAHDLHAVLARRPAGRDRLLPRHRQHGPDARARLRADRGRAARPISCFSTGPSIRPARDLLECVQLGDLPGIGMVVIDGLPRIGRSRNTPPADKVPEVVGGVSLVENERAKLTAAYLNTGAGACFAAGVVAPVAPVAALTFGYAGTPTSCRSVDFRLRRHDIPSRLARSRTSPRVSCRRVSSS